MWDWGTVPAWASAATSLLAFGAVIWQQWLEARRRESDIERERCLREEGEEATRLQKERAQAEQIAAWVEDWQPSPHPERNPLATVYVQNRSGLPIHNLIICLVPLKREGPQKTGEELSNEVLPTCFQRGLGTCPPGTFSAPLEAASKRDGVVGMGSVVEIAFTDASNNSWVRRGDGNLEKLNGDPDQGRRHACGGARWTEHDMLQRVPNL